MQQSRSSTSFPVLLGSPPNIKEETEEVLADRDFIFGDDETKQEMLCELFAKGLTYQQLSDILTESKTKILSIAIAVAPWQNTHQNTHQNSHQNTLQNIHSSLGAIRPPRSGGSADLQKSL